MPMSEMDRSYVKATVHAVAFVSPYFNRVSRGEQSSVVLFPDLRDDDGGERTTSRRRPNLVSLWINFHTPRCLEQKGRQKLFLCAAPAYFRPTALAKPKTISAH